MKFYAIKFEGYERPAGFFINIYEEEILSNDEENLWATNNYERAKQVAEKYNKKYSNSGRCKIVEFEL